MVYHSRRCLSIHLQLYSARIPQVRFALQNTFGDVLDLAKRLHLNCLTQKCEDILSREDFELTTGRSTTDTHSVVRWAHIAQKYHLVVRPLCVNYTLQTYPAGNVCDFTQGDN